MKEIKKSILKLKKYKLFNFIYFLYKFQVNDVTNNINLYIGKDLPIYLRTKIIFDLLCSNLIYGASVLDYFEYNYFLKSSYERRKFINEFHRKSFYSKFNNPDKVEIFRDKYKTYQTFKSYMGRTILFPKLNNNFDEFRNLCCDKEIIIKPNNNSRGRGVKRLGSITAEKEINNLWELCMENNLIVEEVVTAYEPIQRFHSYSLNTLRIASVNTKQGVKIMAAVFRIGNNKSPIDNHASGGIVGAIDTDTGIVFTQGIDMYNNKYIKHPVSGEQIVGFQIPYWEQCKQLIYKLAEVVPDIKYVGWDVALNKEGQWLLIEGNDGGQFDLLQQADQIGKKNEFEQLFTVI